jgi:DNA-binding NarL/FixJ family response regulator
MKQHTSPKKSTVYLIDDHPVILQGISLLINAETDLSVVGTAALWPVAFKEISDLKPDVVVLDITLASANGVEVLKDLKIHFPKQRVLMLSMHDENLYAPRAMKAGAFGYLMKASAAEEIIVAIRKILAGELYLSDSMTSQMMSRIVGRKSLAVPSPLEALTDRELEVYEMVGSGLPTRAIADRLHLSIKTIESHKMHLKQKLNLQNATELAQHAIKGRP